MAECDANVGHALHLIILSVQFHIIVCTELLTLPVRTVPFLFSKPCTVQSIFI